MMVKRREFWKISDEELNAAVAAMCDGLGVSGSVTPLYDLYRVVLGEKRKAAAKVAEMEVLMSDQCEHKTTEVISEKPILFTGDMVRAILSGRKTQTRRVVARRGKVSPQPASQLYPVSDTGFWAESDPDDVDNPINGTRCPYGKPGDLLWVRETWSGHDGERYIYAPQQHHHDIFYRADNDRPTWASGRWRPSIFMPRWASRLILRVEAICVERLQDITDKDAKAEGVVSGWQEFGNGISWLPDPRAEFAILWNKINEGRGFGWESNPWVWVAEFSVVQAFAPDELLADELIDIHMATPTPTAVPENGR